MASVHVLKLDELTQALDETTEALRVCEEGVGTNPPEKVRECLAWIRKGVEDMRIVVAGARQKCAGCGATLGQENRGPLCKYCR